MADTRKRPSHGEANRRRLLINGLDDAGTANVYQVTYCCRRYSCWPAFPGAIGIASLTRLSHHGRLMLGGTLAAFAALLVFSQSTVYAFSLPTLLVMGIGVSGFGSMQGAMTMLLAPKEIRGKALGVVSLAIGSGPFGALIVSSVANEYGPAAAIGAIALAGMILVGLVGIAMPAIRARIA